MQYNIYLHDDFDGRASAAIMLAFFKTRGDSVRHFIPIKFDTSKVWASIKPSKPFVVVDFPYHPNAAFWFDHHPTTFKRPGWRKKFTPSRFHRWDPKYPSCAHLVLDALVQEFEFRPPPHLHELAYWLDVFDGANFSSAKQIIEKREPAFQVEEYIDRKGNIGQPLVWLIRALSQKTLAEIAKDARVRAAARLEKAQRPKALSFYRQNIHVRRGVGTVSFLDERPVRNSRFASYYLYPRLDYMLISKRGVDGVFHMTFSANPWRRGQNSMHIGEYLTKRYGGGGHKNVGGAEFATREAIEEAVEETVRHISNEKAGNGKHKA